ncbi:alpha/beta fold hydrolase [Micromonospora sp. NBC_01813]|uniref:alpha/beta fold hydrolase n=1 Tax=Micromonospora sp. NBC_01813 TaxID=2975988 RepID=UPI002DDB4936|nr:alpha/beta hydrolase [Micromonospora sp. NBC_01813]WSA09144.1 alpha/beta hydrolase [Micromonospora sp. NBC_01813]
MRRLLPRVRRRWIVGGGAALIALVLLIASFALRTPAPVGHFTSAAAQDRFVAAYQRAMTELPSPDQTLDVRTSYGVVRLYHFAGANPEAAPLLLLPGRASAAPVWADNLPALLRLRSVYTIDLLGEPGMSIQQRPIETPADHAQWLHEVLVELPEPRIHLLGLSIGGWTAMNLAVHRPEKIASVMLLDPVLVFADLSWQAIVRSIPASVRWFPRSWRDGFASWTANDAPVDDVPVAQMIEAGMQTYALKLSAPRRLTDEELTRVRTPTLALLAGQSRMHDTAEAAQVADSALPEATVIVYPEASHAINGEYPDRVAADLAEFLATSGR